MSITTQYLRKAELREVAQGNKQVNSTETEHYKVTKDFINHYPKMLKILMEN